MLLGLALLGITGAVVVRIDAIEFEKKHASKIVDSKSGLREQNDPISETIYHEAYINKQKSNINRQ